MLTLADIGPGNVVQRVIIAPAGMNTAEAITWCASNLGGWWVETWQGHPTERYAGKGMVYSPSDDRKFLYASEVV